MLGRMKTPLNHFFNDRIDSGTLEALTGGPLAAHLKTYAQRLHDQGYAVQTGQLQLRMLGHFNRWLQSNCLATDEINSSTLERYIRSRRKAGKLRAGDATVLARMLRMLRPGQVEMASSPPSACQIVLRQFQHYLRQERGLSDATITCYTPVVSAFLAECFPADIPDFHQISASDVTEFVQRQAERITTKHARNVVTALRSFLRHLLHRGAIDTDMAACVPTIATWSLSSVPKFLPAKQIQHVLDCCDRDTAIGKRDYAIPLLLARLGLRAGEVVALRLEDVDWEAGLITVRGKGKRGVQMPLSVEVGAAMADYLRQSRPDCSSRPGQSATGRFRQLHRNLLAG
jgi:integrase/recombinase XerD